MKTIGKRTTKMTKEARAKKLFSELTLEQKNELYFLLGKIICGEVKNFYATKVFRMLTKDLAYNQKAIIAYICRKTNKIKMFEDMDELVLAEE